MLAAIPMGALGTRRTSASRCASSPRAAGYITGQTLIVDGGQVLPEGIGELPPERNARPLDSPGR